MAKEKGGVPGDKKVTPEREKGLPGRFRCRKGGKLSLKGTRSSLPQAAARPEEEEKKGGRERETVAKTEVPRRA